MSVLLTLLMVAAATEARLTAPLDAPYPDAETVYHCNFERPDPGETSSVLAGDSNFDDWPDEWTRQRGPGFPHYQRVTIAEISAAAGRRALMVALEDGATALYSPPIPVDGGSQYVVEGHLRTEGLVRDEAFVGIRFLDATKKLLDVVESPHWRDVPLWRKWRIGPVANTPPGTRYLQVALHTQPTMGVDLQGKVYFDEIRVSRLPRVTLVSGSPHNIFQAAAGQTVELECRLWGYRGAPPELTLEWLDALGSTLDVRQASLTPLPSSAVSATNEPLPSAEAEASESVASTVWAVPIDRPGYYRARARWRGESGFWHTHETSLAVVASAEARGEGEFGWSLHDGEGPFTLDQLAELLTLAGVDRVKFPVWYEAADREREDDLALLLDQLRRRGIRTVGLLHDPPPGVRVQLASAGPPTAAELFEVAPDVWYPTLEPVLTRLALKVPWWQIGRDDDYSFRGDPDMLAKLATTKEYLDRINQDTRLGLPWDWMSAAPGVERPPWQFLVRSTEVELTDRELEAYLRHEESSREEEAWVTLRPLDRDSYTLEQRVADLVARMSVAKSDGAAAVFVSDPIDMSQGLVNNDGTPGELLLPWRTTAAALSGSTYRGTLQMAGGGEAKIFSRGGHDTIVAWSHTPETETIYLGEDARVTDVWGADVTMRTPDGQHRLALGTSPVFISSANAEIDGWRLGTEIERPALPSILGVAHSNRLRFTNPFAREMRGMVRLVAEPSWEIEPAEFEFRLAAGATLERPFEVTLPFDAFVGQHPLRIEVALRGEQRLDFAVHRTIHVGSDDVSLDAITHLTEDGELEIEQMFANQSQHPANYRIQLYAPNRQRLRTSITDLVDGRETTIFRLSRGEELLGKTLWIRAEESDGPVVLNYRFEGRR